MDITARFLDRHPTPGDTLSADAPALPGLGRVARILDLAPAEIRLLHRLMAGDSLADAARLLGISHADAAAVFARLLDKAGAADRRDLEDLVRGVAEGPAP